MKHLSVVFFFILILSFSTSGQFAPGVEWDQCVPNASVRSVVAVSDSVFTIAFDSKSCTDSSAIGLRSYNSDGILLWEKISIPPVTQSFHVFSLSKTNDHGYLFSGSIDSSSSNFNWLVKTDSAGNPQWSRKIFFSDTAKVFCGKSIELQDGNFLWVTDFYSAARREVQVFKLDINGDTIWTKSFGGSLFDYARDAIATDDGGFLIAAYTTSTDGTVSGNHGANDIWLLKIDPTGNLLWQKCYGGTLNEEVRSVLKLNDGYLIGGMSKSNDGDITDHHGSTTYFDEWVFKIDIDGNLIWKKSYGGTNDDFAQQMIALSDGNFLLTGSSYSSGSGIDDHHGSIAYDDQWTIKINATGNVIWQKSTGGSGDDWSNCVAALDSDEVIIAGASIADDGDHHNACYSNDCHVIEGGWIVKLNEHCASYPMAIFSFEQSGKEVTFQNESGNATDYLWDFGDGTVSSDINPSHTYALNGVYVVCLTASDTCSSKTFCLTVSTCLDTLIAAFDVSYPSGAGIQFTGLPVDAAKWNWDFGDGAIDSVQNPMHTYSQNGTYSVTFTVVDSCDNESTISQEVNTCDGFIVDFSYMVTGNTVSFTDLTAGLLSSWSWDFGDGNFSSLQNPDHTYADTGMYTVCLTVNADGCTLQTFCDTISVCNPVSIDSFSFIGSLTEISFFDSSQNATGWEWSFGDGNFSTEQNPVHLYTQGGIYTVCEIVSNNCNSDTLCEVINVECALFDAAFTATQSNDTVSFTDQSVNAIQWQWDFGDGNFSTDENPVHVYGFTGSFLVCLVAYDGCSFDTLCDSVHVIADGAGLLHADNFYLSVFPNPAHDEAVISFYISQSSGISILLYDVSGKEALNIFEGDISEGRHVFSLNAQSLSAGTYFLELKSEREFAVRKLVVN